MFYAGKAEYLRKILSRIWLDLCCRIFDGDICRIKSFRCVWKHLVAFFKTKFYNGYEPFEKHRKFPLNSHK